MVDQTTKDGCNPGEKANQIHSGLLTGRRGLWRFRVRHRQTNGGCALFFLPEAPSCFSGYVRAILAEPCLTATPPSAHSSSIRFPDATPVTPPDRGAGGSGESEVLDRERGSPSRARASSGRLTVWMPCKAERTRGSESRVSHPRRSGRRGLDRRTRHTHRQPILGKEDRHVVKVRETDSTDCVERRSCFVAEDSRSS